MSLLDHLFVVAFALLYPVVGFISFQRLLKKAEAGVPIDRGSLYRSTTINHWGLFFAGLVLWANSARSWSSLGLDLQIDPAFLAAVGLTIAGIVALLLQVRQVMAADQEKLAAIKAIFGKLEIIMPQNGNELTRFYLVSMTAGIVEELLWRGFLIWYLSQAMPLWAAALVSSLGFGLAHAYQGVAQLPKVTLVGGAFAGLYLLSGSLWLPMLLHAAVDIIQGRLAYEVMHRSRNTDEGVDKLDAQPAP